MYVNKRNRSRVYRYRRYSRKSRYPGSRYKPGRFYTSPFLSTPNIVTVPGSNVLPTSLRTQFKFLTKLELTYTGSTTSASALNFKANSSVDPMGSSGTTKPQMFDQLTAYYGRYNVIASKIKITAVNPTDFQYMIYCTPITDLTDSYSSITAPNMPGAKHVVMDSATARGVVTLTNYRRTATIFGLDPGSAGFSATTTSDPPTLWYWHISSYPINPSLAEDYTCDLLIELIQYVVLSCPQNVLNS